MVKTDVIFEFSQLLFSLNVEEDIEIILNSIEKYYIKNFEFCNSLFFLFKIGDSSFYTKNCLNPLSEKDLSECKIVSQSFFPELTEKDIKVESICEDKSNSSLFFPILENSICVGLSGFYSKRKLSTEEKERLSKITLDIGNILYEKLVHHSQNKKLEKAAKEYSREMQTAALLHEKIIPTSNFDFDFLSLRIKYKPYRLIGGDYYNCYEIEHGKYLIAMGDAAGKGMAGALISNMFHIILKYIVFTEKQFDMQNILININRFLCDSIDSFHFIATLFIYVDANNNFLKVCNCGHYAPIFYNDKNIFETFKSNPPLGIGKNIDFEIEKIDFKDNINFVCFTDGMAEDFDQLAEIKNYIEEYNMLSIDNMRDLLYSKMYNEKCSDDITLIVGNINSGDIDLNVEH